ncbi:MAG: histidine triad nucleotide-binding protein [Actinomycetales bacterium]|nr:histidine triad nucleotide-binding protein [Actinomycetales bacterium]
MTAKTDCLFCGIASGDIPADIVLRDEHLLSFRDINPQAPVHVLVIPVAHYSNAGQLADADPMLAGQLLEFASRVADQEGVSGYRIVMNTGADAGQSVFHVHAHVLGGRSLTWPPG